MIRSSIASITPRQHDAPAEQAYAAFFRSNPVSRRYERHAAAESPVHDGYTVWNGTYRLNHEEAHAQPQEHGRDQGHDDRNRTRTTTFAHLSALHPLLKLAILGATSRTGYMVA